MCVIRKVLHTLLSSSSSSTSGAMKIQWYNNFLLSFSSSNFTISLRFVSVFVSKLLSIPRFDV